MPPVELLRALAPHRLGLADDRVIVFGVLGGRRAGPTLLVHGPTLLVQLRELADDVERVVFSGGSSPDAMTIATIKAMLSAMGSEDGLVQFRTAAEAIKLTRGGIIDRAIDRSTLVSFCPPEVLRVTALVSAAAALPLNLEEWVNPAGLVAANGGRIETYLPA